MKKNLYTFLLILFFNNLLFSQSVQIDSLTNKYQSTSIIKLDSLKKDYIYNKTLQWVSLNFKSAKDVIQFTDEEKNRIIIKANFKTDLFMKEGWIGYTLTIDFKDGKLKYLFTDFDYYSSGSGKMKFESKTLGFKKKIIQETDDNIIAFESNLKKFLLSKEDVKKEDW